MGGQGSGRYPKGARETSLKDAEEWEELQRRLAHGEDIAPSEVLTNRFISREVILHTVDRLLESEDTELAQVIRGLTWKALLQANNILERGEHRDRMTIIRLLLTNAAKLIGATSTTTVEDSRVALSEILDEMKVKVETSNAPIAALTAPIDDSN